MNYLFFQDEWPIVQSGGLVPENAIELTEEQYVEVTSAIQDQEKKIIQTENGYSILDVPPPPPRPDYLAFWDALMSSSVYASIREQSFTSLPMNTLATEFIALIGDAKAGRPNETAIQFSISAILETGTFTEEHLIELQEALEAGHLENIYTITE